MRRSDARDELQYKEGEMCIRDRVKGGESGQLSIYNGLVAVYNDSHVPHDSVRCV